MVDFSRLLVKKLPSFLSVDDKESLLKFFGAVDVTVMASKGPMKNCAFATFVNPADARMAMTKLHQLNVLGSHLIVVYATCPPLFHGGSVDSSWRGDKVTTSDNTNTSSIADRTKGDPLPSDNSRSSVSLPQLIYEYPPPTQLIINNIGRAIAAVPMLYTQVLHLMNKMNLPPPFGEPLPAVELAPGDERKRSSSGEESEMSSSSSEEDTIKRYTKTGRKRKRMPKKRSLNLKQLKETMPLEGVVVETPTKPARRIEINVPQELNPSSHTTVVENIFTIASTPLQPMEETTDNNRQQQLQESHDEVMINEDFITYSELQLNRVSIEEMQESDVFKKYSKGEPSMRLYIKNLSKQVTEKDLTHIFGRYIDWNSNEHKNSFNVRVMQQGRMKGQAFVGLPSEEIAAKALGETLGYKLYDKPMVVQFARSTKAKETITW